jgi:hypothetical protein
MKQGLPMSAITMAEGSGRASGAFKNMGRIFSVLPAAAGAPGKKLSSLSKKQLMSLSQSISAGPLLSSSPEYKTMMLKKVYDYALKNTDSDRLTIKDIKAAQQALKTKRWRNGD